MSTFPTCHPTYVHLPVDGKEKMVRENGFDVIPTEVEGTPIIILNEAEGSQIES
jgi:hypothetical protein